MLIAGILLIAGAVTLVVLRRRALSRRGGLTLALVMLLALGGGTVFAVQPVSGAWASEGCGPAPVATTTPTPAPVPDPAPTPEPTTTPPPGTGEIGYSIYFHVTNMPDGGKVTTRRLWDDYNLCVDETNPLTDDHVYTANNKRSDGVLEAGLWVSTRQGGTCFDSDSRLHWMLDFWNANGSLAASWEVQMHSGGIFGTSVGFTSVCQPSGNVDAVRCSTQGHTVTDATSRDSWQDFHWNTTQAPTPCADLPGGCVGVPPGRPVYPEPAPEPDEVGPPPAT